MQRRSKTTSEKIISKNKEPKRMHPLFQAVKLDDHKEIIHLLKQGADINCRNEFHETPLIEAVRNHHKQCVQLLINQGSNVNAENHQKATALILAARYGYVDLIPLLINAGAYVNHRTKEGNTVLIKLAQHDQAETMQFLIQNNAEINVQNKQGDTALIVAAQYGHAGLLPVLIDNNVDINLANKNGDTALMVAIRKEYTGFASFLLRLCEGVELNCINKEGKSAIWLAAYHGHIGLVATLIKRYAFLNQKDHYGETPLIAAIKSNINPRIKLLIIELLIENRINCNLASDCEGFTPLMIATLKNYPEIVELLIKKGNAAIHTKNQFTQTALDIAKENKFPEIIRILNSVCFEVSQGTSIMPLMSTYELPMRLFSPVSIRKENIKREKSKEESEFSIQPRKNQ